MSYFLDISYGSINKFGEELCGDKVEVIKREDSAIIVVADGLGSGVKANILSTLTSKIAVTMLKEGASIFETVDTIINTLPVCQVRKLAYSTFTIAQLYEDGRAYISEYDNPPLFLIRDGKPIYLEKKETLINGTLVKESETILEKGDLLAIVSDGVIHAGVGGALNLGWQWENTEEYLNRLSSKEKSARNISRSLLDTCHYLYVEEPGDDTTAVIVRVREPEVVNLFTGPPKNPANDVKIVERFMKSKGKKIVCGGTAANIVARELKTKINTSMNFIDPEVPPLAAIEGMDLVTEGVLTLSKTVEKIKKYLNSPYKDNSNKIFKGEDAASKLSKILIEECTHLNLWVGKAINPAHQNPDLSIDLSIKLRVVDELVGVMKELGAKVNVNYI